MHAPVLITAPAALPVTLEEFKFHARIDGTAEDSMLPIYLSAATAHLDGWKGILGQAILTQTWRQDFDGFSRLLRLPLGPVASITSVTWRDSAAVQSTVDVAEYQLLRDGLGAYIRFRDAFSPPADLAEAAGVSVTFVAGAGTAPATVKVAVLLLAAHWYEHREAAGEAMSTTPLGFDRLVDAIRLIGV